MSKSTQQQTPVKFQAQRTIPAGACTANADMNCPHCRNQGVTPNKIMHTRNQRKKFHANKK